MKREELRYHTSFLLFYCRHIISENAFHMETKKHLNLDLGTSLGVPIGQTVAVAPALDPSFIFLT